MLLLWSGCAVLISLSWLKLLSHSHNFKINNFILINFNKFNKLIILINFAESGMGKSKHATWIWGNLGGSPKILSMPSGKGRSESLKSIIIVRDQSPRS